MSRGTQNGKHAAPPPPQCRCAIYTRKSSEEGLKQEFNSLDALDSSIEVSFYPSGVKALAGGTVEGPEAQA